jgi:pimeloyl-ACP methyl ester carboxylesterase
MLFAVLKLAARVPGGIRLLAETMRFRLAWRMPVSLAGLAKSRFDRDLVDAWFAPAREDAGVRRDAARVIRGVDKRYTLSAVDGLRRFDRPALILWPRHAPHFPFEHAERLAKDLPNSTLVEIADSYAFVSLDQPQATAAAIAAFLD